MDLPTYTNIWRIEKRLYKLYDFRLPMPLPVGTFGVALGVFALWVVLLSVLNAPFAFGNGWHLVLWVVPPGVITVLATRPVVEGKRLTELLISQARFLTEARVYTRMAPEYEPAEIRVTVRVWHRDPSAGPLVRPGRRRAERVEHAEWAEAGHEAVDLAAEAAAARPAPEEAPPLREVAVPEGVVEPEPVAAEEPAYARAEADRVPVAVAAGSEENARGRQDELPRYRAAGSSGDPGQGGGSRRGVGRRVLNYFGFALGSGSPESRDEPESDLPGDADGFDDEPLYGTERDEQRGSAEWFANLRASSGETPVGLTSKGAYSVGDTGALSGAELAEAVADPALERRRAEEVMAAPEPLAEESPAARRLRGRVQGIRVTKELDERRTEHVRERAPREAPQAPPVRVRGRALPATEEPRPVRRRERPHAAPWELERLDTTERKREPGATGDPGLSDYAARYAAATGRPASGTPAAPWLPPASGAPDKEEQDRTEAARAPVADPEETRDAPEDSAAAPTADTRDAPEDSVAAPMPDTARAEAEPPLELDHGTGEQTAMPPRQAEDTGDRAPDWNEHMSVLDQHLITADTPAPPRPKFADAVPENTRGVGDRDPSEWFEDGKKRHPDQPKVGDRGNPVIPASELREEQAVAAESEDESGTDAPEAEEERADGPKPPTQLDHGTGELVSFAEVRDEPDRTSSGNPRTAAEDESARRRTTADLERAEAAALARRRADARPDQAAEPAAQDPRAHPSMAGAVDEEPATEMPLWGEGTAGRTDRPSHVTASDPSDPSDPSVPFDPSVPPESGDPHDGVFHRVAQNARRLGQLFGQPAPGEEPEPLDNREVPKPELELDHGTGEQERLGDTPNGVPSQRPTPPERAREEPGSESGGTRGWRRLAKVVTGGATPVRSDLPASDIERLRAPLDGPRGLVVLGCTGGAGQTVTTLMIGHTLAAHRDEPVVAVDVNPGPNGLSRRIGAQTPETLTALLANADAVTDYSQMRGYTNQASTGLEVVQTLDDPYVQTLDDRDYGQLTDLLGGFYGVTLLDPAATGVARALPVADGLVLVAPASADAERAVSMTFEWLDGNGYSALRANSVLVVNGVSKRSLGDVDAAERVARGRCRAIVRIPWDDHLGSSYTRIDVGALRPATKRAHGALGGVLVHSLASC